MRVILLNDGGYTGGMDEVPFPVEVEAAVNKNAGVAHILGSELLRVGAKDSEIDSWDPEFEYCFLLGLEVVLP